MCPDPYLKSHICYEQNDGNVWHETAQIQHWRREKDWEGARTTTLKNYVTFRAVLVSYVCPSSDKWYEYRHKLTGFNETWNEQHAIRGFFTLVPDILRNCEVGVAISPRDIGLGIVRANKSSKY
jgi:hypothetical protein